MSFLMGYVLGAATSSSRHSSEEEQLKTKCNKLKHQIADLSKKVERLQEQLAEANEVIKWYAQPDTGSAKDYLKKWGVKCKKM